MVIHGTIRGYSCLLFNTNDHKRPANDHKYDFYSWQCKPFTSTPSPYGYSPCLGESASDYVERIHCRRPKGSVNPTALSLFEGDERNAT